MPVSRLLMRPVGIWSLAANRRPADLSVETMPSERGEAPGLVELFATPSPDLHPDYMTLRHFVPARARTPPWRVWFDSSPMMSARTLSVTDFATCATRAAF